MKSLEFDFVIVGGGAAGAPTMMIADRCADFIIADTT